jgi:hypothetical protein
LGQLCETGVAARGPAHILEDILGYFVLLAPFAAPFGYKISDWDIGYFAILQQMSGFADRIFGYFAILQQMSGFADRIFGYFAILLHVQVPGTRTCTVSAPAPDPYIGIFVDNDFISGYLSDFWRKKTSDIFSHDKSLKA